MLSINFLQFVAVTVLLISGQSAAKKGTSGNNKPGRLTVTGEGRSDIGTTLTQITMEIKRSTKCDINSPPDECSALDVQEKMNKVTQPLIAYLSAYEGVKSVQADGLSIQQQNKRQKVPIDNSDCEPCIDRFDDNREVPREDVYRTYLTGYEATTTIVAVVPSADVGLIVDQSLQYGVNDIDDVQFFVDAKTLNDAKYAALAKATTNAVNQASAALGVYDEMVLSTKLAEVPFENYFDDVPYTTGPSLIGDDAVMETVQDGKLVGGIKTVGYQVKLALLSTQK